MKKTLFTFSVILASLSLFAQTSDSLKDEIKEIQKKAKLTFNEGVRFTIDEKYTEAHLKFDEALFLLPEYDLPYLERAKIKILNQEFDLAMNDIAKAIEINEEQGEAFYVRGYMKLLMKDYQNALTDFTRAIQKGYTEAEAYYFRGLMYFELSDFNSALIDFTLAIDKKYDFAYAFNERGSSKRMLGDYHGAIHDYIQSLSYDSTIFLVFTSGLSWL